jgi:glycosyltransferase involved in cell wall biosynthesis
MTRVTNIEKSRKKKLFIILPVYNDWNSLALLVDKITHLDFQHAIHLIIVDDCSSEVNYDLVRMTENLCKSIGATIDVLELSINRGNQFAIWVGLNFLDDKVSFDSLIVIMDSDGEDNPKDIFELISAHREGIPTVAKRGKRSNSKSFKLWHGLYKVTFKFFTGKVLDFGNFSVIDGIVLKRLLSNEKANYLGYVGGLISVNQEIDRVLVNRDKRYFGKSKSNVQRLIQWGLLQASPFTDSILAQTLKLSVKFTLASLSISIILLVIRILEFSVIPGWTSLFVFFALASSFSIMIVTAMFLTVFFLLNGVRIELKLMAPPEVKHSVNVQKFLAGYPSNE